MHAQTGRVASRPHWRHRIRLACVGVLITIGLAGVYLIVGGWLASRSIMKILTIGGTNGRTFQVHAPEGPFDIGYRGDPLQALGLEFEDVMIDTDLGGAPAWLVPCDEPDARTWAVYVHGIGGCRENGYKYLSVFHEAGIPTLIITYRNDEGAPAAPNGIYAFGLGEWHDLDAAVAFLRDQGAERIVLSAESMGGGIVGQFLMRSRQADCVTALVLDAPALDFPEVVADLAQKMGYPLAPQVTGIALWFASRRQDVRLGQAVSFDAVEIFPGPVFLSHGANDSVVPVAISDRLVTKRFGATTYLRTRADHVQSWAENPERYRTQLRAFLSTVG